MACLPKTQPAQYSFSFMLLALPAALFSDNVPLLVRGAPTLSDSYSFRTITENSDTAMLSNLSWILLNFQSFAIKLLIGFQHFTSAVSLIFDPS